uniref:Uncharacterized protein n=1 Tax=Panagrolaimus sp. PS1159 TaxID=55785 RepID=A0AC35GHG2_9BILA
MRIPDNDHRYDDEDTIRFPATPKQIHQKPSCPNAPKPKKVKRVIVSDDDEEDVEDTQASIPPKKKVRILDDDYDL